MSTVPSRELRFLSSSLALAVGLGALLVGGPAGAYCRTTTASTPTFEGHVCTPAQPDDTGIPLYWGMPRISYSLQREASEDVPLESARSAVRAAFDTWMAAECDGGEPPRIELVEATTAECALTEYNKECGNANIILFRDTSWDDDASRLAITTVSFDTESGEIYDADMALNSELWQFTTTGTGTGIDLLSVLTHETGHFLGLAHSSVPEATMTATYSPPQVEDLRSLAEDDRAGICAIYPPAPVAESCDSTPRHGFSPLCAADQPGPVPGAPDPAADRCCCLDGDECVDGRCLEVPGACTCSTSPPAQTLWLPLLPVAIAMAALARRRAGRSRRAGRRATARLNTM